MTKYLYVCEYNDSYTGGSLVVIASPATVAKVSLKNSANYAGSQKIKLITDQRSCQCYTLSQLSYISRPVKDWTDMGILPSLLVSHMRKSGLFTEEFIQEVQVAIDPLNQNFPGYRHNGNNRVRVDWLITNMHLAGGLRFTPDVGLYVVYQTPVNSGEKDRVVSDTYYCA